MKDDLPECETCDAMVMDVKRHQETIAALRRRVDCADVLDPCRDCYACLRRDYDSQIPQWQERAFAAEIRAAGLVAERDVYKQALDDIVRRVHDYSAMWDAAMTRMMSTP